MNELALQIKRQLEELDILMRPKALIVNPLDEETIREELPEIEEKVYLCSTNAIERGQAYIVDRNYLKEFWKFEPLGGDGE